MKRYETVIIVDPDLSEDVRLPLFEKFRETISQQQGELIAFEEWGSQKLAYEVRKKMRGFYVRVDYCGAGKAVDELERQCRLDDRVLKYLNCLT
ncbi:MAG: 30S ribosomal protein S6 [Desulfobacteraceae bacterium]|nr:30S ribosomal protein S6 [Desulfobacteraceae bacterium]